MKKVAFQGEKGAFSEDAATRFWKQKIEPVPQRSFREVFNAVTDGRCDFGIIPIENSLAGSIHENIDLLLEYHLSICGEIILRIRHNLLALKDVTMEQIRRVQSHPQALRQCSKFLESLENVDILPMYDTAGSARHLMVHQLKDTAAIASFRAGEDYGLTILKKDIENNHQNYTRFLVIAETPQNHTEDNKTSIVFSTKDIPGALFKALSVFALRDINLLKIESRPLQKGPWKYWFYLDFEGSMSENPCRKAISHLEEITDFIKILGSYPKGRIIE